LLFGTYTKRSMFLFACTCSMLKAAVLKHGDYKDQKEMARLMAVGSLCLFNRNQEMSRLQSALGLVLDDGGATDEVNY
jgi:hypothetical protein